MGDMIMGDTWRHDIYIESRMLDGVATAVSAVL
jgi:hypothetical protein